MNITRVKPGDPITSAQYNALCDAIENAGGLRPGGDFQFRLGFLGSTLDIIPGGWEALVPARITGAPSGMEVPEDECRYSLVAIGKPDWELGDIKPRYARPLRGHDVKMVPAKVGDFCFMVRAFEGEGKFDPDAWVPTEAYVTARCVAPSPAGGSPLRAFTSIIPAIRPADGSSSTPGGNTTTSGTDS